METFVAKKSKKVRVAIIGVGNCASSLVQGVQYYQNAKPADRVPGLMHVDLGGYHVRDIEFTAAFDVVDGKVGRDLSEAIFAPPNNTIKFADVPNLGVKVERGMTHDGLGKYVSTKVTKAGGPTADIVRILRETNTDVVVSYLPVGSEMATKWYVEQVLEAGCGFVNCIPVFIASAGYWGRSASPSAVCRSSATTSRVPGGRHHHPPRADQPVPRPRRAARPHLPAQFWRQHDFSTCSSASGSNPRRFPRPTRSLPARL